MTAYKPSGFDWLGDIPIKWGVSRFRYVFRESKEVNGSSPVGEMLSVSGYKGVVPKVYVSDSLKRDDDQLETYRVVRKGQLAVNTMWLNYSGLGISEFEGHMSPAYRAYWVSKKVHGRYMHHLLRSQIYVSAYTSFLTGVRPNSLQMSRDNLMSFPILLPSIEEQRAIADFLDRELAQLDILIQKQKLLKQLSSERRQATISKLVTHGHRSNNSHWRLCRLKDVANIFASNVDKKTYDDGVQVRLCNYVDVYYNDRIVNELPFMEATASLQEIKKFQLKSGWVIATKDSESASDIGIAAYVEKDLPGVVCGYHLAILEPSKDLNGLFLKYFLDCSETKIQLAQRATGLTRVGLGKNDFGTLRIQLPPLEEQVSIAQEITAECERIDRLGIQTDELIAKLQERRRALINSAVTGKIDVRGKN